jgi:hypothetical protein
MVVFEAGGFHSDGRSVFWREGFSVFFLTQIIFTGVIKKLIIYNKPFRSWDLS